MIVQFFVRVQLTSLMISPDLRSACICIYIRHGRHFSNLCRTHCAQELSRKRRKVGPITDWGNPNSCAGVHRQCSITLAARRLPGELIAPWQSCERQSAVRQQLRDCRRLTGTGCSTVTFFRHSVSAGDSKSGVFSCCVDLQLSSFDRGSVVFGAA